MIMLIAHLRALKTWLFFGGWHHLFLFFSSIPILWLFWGICSPLLVSGKIDFKNTFLALFAAWYSIAYLQDFTNNDSVWGLTGSYYLPACPCLPISPLMRTAAELVFFFIVTILVFLPFFIVAFLLKLNPEPFDFSAIQLLKTSLQGTLAIAPIVFCLRINVNGAFIIPTTLRTSLPVILCGAFVLFQISGLFSTLKGSLILFSLQISILCALFIGFQGPNQRLGNLSWSKYFSKYILDDSVLCLLMGKKNCRTAKPPQTQILWDLSKIIILYLAYWLCFYFPLLGMMYYFFIHVLNKPAMLWFFFFLLFIFPTQDSHSLRRRFILPILTLPLRTEIVIRRFYILFSLGIIVIWTLPFLLVTFIDAVNLISYLPLVLLFAPTMAGVWINQIARRPALAYTGVALLCSFPLGYYLNLVQLFPVPFIFLAFIGALLPLGSMLRIENFIKKENITLRTNP